MKSILAGILNFSNSSLSTQFTSTQFTSTQMPHNHSLRILNETVKPFGNPAVDRHRFERSRSQDQTRARARAKLRLSAVERLPVAARPPPSASKRDSRSQTGYPKGAGIRIERGMQDPLDIGRNGKLRRHLEPVERLKYILVPQV